MKSTTLEIYSKSSNPSQGSQWRRWSSWRKCQSNVESWTVYSCL